MCVCGIKFVALLFLAMCVYSPKYQYFTLRSNFAFHINQEQRNRLLTATAITYLRSVQNVSLEIVNKREREEKEI